MLLRIVERAEPLSVRGMTKQECGHSSNPTPPRSFFSLIPFHPEPVYLFCKPTEITDKMMEGWDQLQEKESGRVGFWSLLETNRHTIIKNSNPIFCSCVSHPSSFNFKKMVAVLPLPLDSFRVNSSLPPSRHTRFRRFTMNENPRQSTSAQELRFSCS